MQLDEMKSVWATHSAALERSLAIDEQLLREMLTRKVRWTLAPFVLLRGLEVALGFVITLAAVSVLADHLREPLYLVGIGVLLPISIVVTVQCGRLLVGAVQLDFGAPVVRLRREVEELRVVEYSTFLWALLGGTAAWLPALAVLIEAATGAEVLAKLPMPWLVGNIALGVVALVVGVILSRRYVARSNRSPRAQRFVEALSSHALRRALEHLAELEAFGREDSVIDGIDGGDARR